MTKEQRLRKNEWARKDYAAHRDSRAVRAKQYRAAHYEKIVRRERRWKAENPDKVRGQHRQRVFGVSRADYARMLAEQGGVCALCLKPETVSRNGFPFNLGVDHEHGTGKVRALLCHKCNVSVGLLGEDPTLMRRAADYIERHR